MQFCLKANWKLNNNYSNSIINITQTLFNIFNKEINKKQKYGFYLTNSLMKTGVPSLNRCISFMLHIK